MSRKRDESYHLPQPDLPTVLASQSLSLRAFNRAEQEVNDAFSRLSGDFSHSLYDRGGLLNEQALEHLLEEPFPDMPVSSPLNREAIIADGLSEELSKQLSMERKPLRRGSETQVPVAGDESMANFGRVDKGKNSRTASTELENRSELKSFNLIEQLQNTSDSQRKIKIAELLQEKSSVWHEIKDSDKYLTIQSQGSKQRSSEQKASKQKRSTKGTEAVRSENAGDESLASNSHKLRATHKYSDVSANVQTISAHAATKMLEEKWGPSALNRAWSSPLQVNQSNSHCAEITEEETRAESKLSTNSIQDTEQKLKQKIELLLQKNTAEGKSLYEGSSIDKYSSTERNGNRNPRNGFQALSEQLKKQYFSNAASEKQGVALLSPAKASMPGSLSSRQGQRNSLSGAKEEHSFSAGISDANNDQISSVKAFTPGLPAPEKASGLVGLRGLASRAAENNTVASTSGRNQAGSVNIAATTNNAPTTEKLQQPSNPIQSSQALSVAELAEMIAREARRSGINLEQFRP